MKVCIIQPAYSMDVTDADRCFEAELALLAQCDETMDLIVLPESCDIPCYATTREQQEQMSAAYRPRLLAYAAETAKRCRAMLFVNARSEWPGGLRNTTYAFDREGRLAGQYHKQHLVPNEVMRSRLDSAYSFAYEPPTVVELEGLRFGFLTCYDFYFYEAFSNLARQGLDIIIGCSHQRSDTYDALRFMTQNLAYNTNTYVVRASVSMGEDAALGGCSMIVAPTGKILADMESRVGMTTVDFDPQEKYYKPAGFGNPPAPHYAYIEEGRRPWKYRPAGSAIVPPDAFMPYPRVCAHRGFNTIAPENSLPAYGAAVAMGAEEIEFDLWFTKDGEAVSIHDPTLERVSNGTGFVWEYTLEELRRLDFGVWHNDAFRRMRIPTLEDLLRKFACHCVMNIHLKTNGEKPAYLDHVVRLIRQYDCVKHVYFMTGEDPLLERLQKEYPDIARCCGAGKGPWQIVDRAIRFGCRKVQLFKPYFDQAMIDKAHANGIVCNVFWSDDPEETARFLDMGIDVILTNDYHRISEVVDSREKHALY